MFGFLRLVKNLTSFNCRMAADEEKQTKDGYRITFTSQGPERDIRYFEGDREVIVMVDFSWWNDVLLYTDSLRRWYKPYGVELTEFDFQKVLNRVTSYMSCWGNVTLNDSKLPTQEDFKRSLMEQGIKFEELENGVIHYSIDGETLRREQKKEKFRDF